MGSFGSAALFGRHLDHLPADADARHDDERDDDSREALMKLRMVVRERRKHPARHLVPGWLLVVLCFLTLSKNVRADGGTVLCQRTIDSVLVTVFSTQSPLRPGQSEISFLVESVADSHPILDAQVFVELENDSGTRLRAAATREQARNKLLYCSLIYLPAAGHWTMKIIVNHGGGKSVLFHHFTVAGSQSPLLAHWRLMIIPPLCVLLFIMNQWLRSRREDLW